MKLRKMSQAMFPHIPAGEIWAKLGGFQFLLIGVKNVLEGKVVGRWQLSNACKYGHQPKTTLS